MIDIREDKWIEIEQVADLKKDTIKNRYGKAMYSDI